MLDDDFGFLNLGDSKHVISIFFFHFPLIVWVTGKPKVHESKGQKTHNMLETQCEANTTSSS